MNKYQINEDHIKYYQYLEHLRKSGKTNMYGASLWLESEYGLDKDKARTILAEWMNNYNELNTRFGW